MVDEQIEQAIKACQNRIEIEAEHGLKESVSEKLDSLFGGELSEDCKMRLMYTLSVNAKRQIDMGGNPTLTGLSKAFIMGLELGKQYEAERVHV